MLRAIRQGFRHLAAAPGLILLTWGASLLVALPAAVIVEEAIHDSVASSLSRESLAEGFDTGWYGEFKAEARGLAATLAPSQIGIGASLDALEAWWSGRLFTSPLPVLAFGLVFGLVWLLLSGGVLSRLLRPWGESSTGEVLATGSRYFARFLRLALLSAPLYFGIFRLASWLFPWLERRTRDVTTETSVLAYNLLGAALIVGLLITVKLVFDFARISMVVEGRRSALAAMLRGAGFVLSRPVAVFGLVVVFAVIGVAFGSMYAKIAPGAAQSTPLTILLAILGSQLFLIGRSALRLALISSQVALFDGHRAGGS